ncbi:MAG: hypothetical protein EON60_06580 [Alphaproteobacteria bacterium]|nr:MAG: hypothetical protein EON60_06580 [Alphaproteobacteria bacterium]
MIKTSLTFAILAAGMVITPFAHTQERTAGNTTDVQMSWSILSNKIQTNTAKTDAVTARVDQSVTCGKKGMVYGPGADDADDDGCVTPVSDCPEDNIRKALGLSEWPTTIIARQPGVSTRRLDLFGQDNHMGGRVSYHQTDSTHVCHYYKSNRKLMSSGDYSTCPANIPQNTACLYTNN